MSDVTVQSARASDGGTPTRASAPVRRRVALGAWLVAHLGPWVVVGERARLESGRRTSTLKAVTAVKVAAIQPDPVEPALLAELALHHRGEVATGPGENA